MASLVAETTWAYINSDIDDSNGVEISKFNSALLMSLLEDSHGEDYTDEQVNRVIQSLQAEINNANKLEAGHDHDLAMEPEFLVGDDTENSDENRLSSIGFEWADMELAVPSSSSDDMNWYTDHCGNGEMHAMVEYGKL